MITTRELLAEGRRRGPELSIALHEAWKALQGGHGGSDDFELVLNDLAEFTEYYFVAQPGTPGDVLVRREGSRAVFARILFLLDVPMTTLGEWRKAALVELDVTNQEGER